jgi:hypothetical protein
VEGVNQQLWLEDYNQHSMQEGKTLNICFKKASKINIGVQCRKEKH